MCVDGAILLALVAGGCGATNLLDSHRLRLVRAISHHPRASRALYMSQVFSGSNGCLPKSWQLRKVFGSRCKVDCSSSCREMAFAQPAQKESAEKHAGWRLAMLALVLGILRQCAAGGETSH